VDHLTSLDMMKVKFVCPIGSEIKSPLDCLTDSNATSWPLQKRYIRRLTLTDNDGVKLQNFL